ncbi:MAG: hypothetical protein IT563_25490 [Alphaproteobacteria bacterium]|nr:hypothetical protein [Alphaproteobacteria bacterium]
MTYRLFALVAALVLSTSAALAPARAEEAKMACGDRTELLAHLKDKYHENQTGFGITQKGGVVELMTSEDGSWTLILSFANGRSCLMATGQGWELWKNAVGKEA